MAHRNARLTPHGRLLLCRRIEDEGWTVAQGGRGGRRQPPDGVQVAARRRAEGAAGLLDRSSRPRARPAHGRRLLRRIVLLRLRLRVGPPWIGWLTGAPRRASTRPAPPRPEPPARRSSRSEPVVRYCWPRAGDLVHLDTKKLGRIAPAAAGTSSAKAQTRHRGLGWNFVHVAVDDATRLAYAEELPDELGTTAAAFLVRALAFFAAHGIEVHRLLTDNGSPYLSRAFRAVVEDRGLRHLRTRPYRPQTNGKAEAFVKLVQNGWAYRRPYATARTDRGPRATLPTTIATDPMAVSTASRRWAGSQVNNL